MELEIVSWNLEGRLSLCCYDVSDPIVTYAEQSTRLYDKMERDLQENGPKFLKQGETSQSLSLSDLFTLKDGSISPILKVECYIFTLTFIIMYMQLDIANCTV